MQIPINELSLFFPCHNEAENLDALVAEALSALPTLAERYEVILVDDGSTDATPAVAARLEASHPNAVRVIRHDINRGYGGALRSGFGGAKRLRSVTASSVPTLRYGRSTPRCIASRIVSGLTFQCAMWTVR